MDSVKISTLIALKSVIDPEVGLDVVTIGLVYAVEIAPDSITVVMTLTTPNCPMGPSILAMAKDAVEAIADGRQVEIRTVWNPPWSPAMLSQGGRERLAR